MRKFWKIENNVNVRKSETLKSRKLVNKKIKRPTNVDWSRPKVTVSLDEMKDVMIRLKELCGISKARDLLQSFGYNKILDVKAHDCERITRAAQSAIYDFTH